MNEYIANGHLLAKMADLSQISNSTISLKIGLFKTCLRGNLQFIAYIYFQLFFFETSHVKNRHLCIN